MKNYPPHYAFARRRGASPAKALQIAREKSGTHDYFSTWRVWGTRDYTWSNPDDRGIAWIENIQKAGLRFVGYADEIINLGHTGWFANEFQDETYRGAVLQRQAVDGKPCYLAAYADPNNEGTFRVDVREWFIDDKESAARLADSMAENVAEKEREHQEAFQHGNDAADKMHSAISIGREIIRHLRRAKELCAVSLATYGVDAEKLAGDEFAAAQALVDEYQDAREIAISAIDDQPYNTELRATWRDGYRSY